jgi:hypothetical protein
LLAERERLIGLCRPPAQRHTFGRDRGVHSFEALLDVDARLGVDLVAEREVAT